MSFDGKVVLIILGGHAGINVSATEYFAKENAKLALVGLNKYIFDRVFKKIERSGIIMEPFIINEDITKNAERIIDETITKYGRLDILLNNAAYTMPISIENLRMKDYDEMMARNVRGIVQLTHFAVPHLIQTKGNIINNASVCGLIPVEHFLAYCMTKAALDQFTKCVALELAISGVRVNCISPECIDSDIHTFINIDRDEEEKIYETILKQNNVNNPIESNEQAIDCVSAIALLANETRLTGVVVPCCYTG